MKTRLTMMMVLMACLWWLPGSAAGASQQRLDADYFWFDNPDGTIEEYPQYIDPMMQGWAMSISSSRYAPGLKYEPTGQYKDVLNLMFGRQTRTTVYVMDTNGMDDARLGATAKAAVALTSKHSSTVMGYLAAIWSALDDLVTDKTGHTVKSDYRDGMDIGKPQQVMFMGKEAIRITYKMDMARSRMMCAFGMPMLFIFDQYVYLDDEAQKMVAVVFQSTTLTDMNDMAPDNRDYTQAFNALSKMLGYGGKDPNKTRLEEAFPMVDMKDYFAQHFHLKLVPPRDKPCVTQATGKGANIDITICGQHIPPEILIGCPGPPEHGGGGGGGGQQPPGKNPPPPPLPHDPPVDPPLPPQPPQPPVFPEDSLKAGNLQRSNSKFAVIQLPEGVKHTMCEDADNIYFLEPVNSWGTSSNAVVAISKYTGGFTDVIAPQTRVSRANIHHIGSDGKSLYFASEELGVRRYDGKSLDSSPQIVNGHCQDNGELGRIIFSPNGRYLAYAGNCCYVYDMEDGNKRVKRYLGGSFADAVLTNDGDIYKAYEWEVAAARNNGIENDDNIDSRSVGIMLGGGPKCLQLVGDNVYMVGLEKVAKTDCHQFQWSEAGSVSPLEVDQACITPQGQGFAVVSGGMNQRFAAFTVSPDNVTVSSMGDINTGIKDKSGREVTARTASMVYIDNNGNIWLQTSNNTFIVYNPDGINGLNNAAGTYVVYKR